MPCTLTPSGPALTEAPFIVVEDACKLELDVSAVIVVMVALANVFELVELLVDAAAEVDEGIGVGVNIMVL